MSTDLDRQRTIDIHANDIRDIKILRETPAFAQYWMRRLRQKRDETDKKFHDDDCDPMAREGYRKQVALCDELLKMMDVDEAASMQALARLLPVVQS